MRAIILALALASPASAQWTVDAFAGGGFSGRYVETAIEHPSFIDVGDGRFIVSPDSVDLVKGSKLDWKPTLLTGARLLRQFSSGFELGVSVTISFLTEEDGATKPFPGANIHVGKNGKGLVLGYTQTTSHVVDFPPGVERFRVGRNALPDLLARNSSQFGRLTLAYYGLSLNLAGG